MLKRFLCKENSLGPRWLVSPTLGVTCGIGTFGFFNYVIYKGGIVDPDVIFFGVTLATCLGTIVPIVVTTSIVAVNTYTSNKRNRD